MRKVILDEAVELSKQIKKFSDINRISIYEKRVVIKPEEFMGMFEEYTVEPMKDSPFLTCRVVTEYNGIEVRAYMENDDVQKYGIDI